MPQTTNLRVMREMEFCPVGPGTVFNMVNHISAATRDRVKLVNKTEEARLERVQRLIDKEHRFNTNLQNKIIERTSKSLKEKRAMLQLLERDYKVDRFITMKPGFDPRLIEDKENARRYIIESRVFNSGFNMKAMKPEVYRRMKKLDPNHKYKVFKKRLLASCREANVEIDRSISDNTFYNMLTDREHWREINYRRSEERCRLPTPLSREAGHSSARSRDVNIEHQGDNMADEIEAVRQENVETEEPKKEKSVVLERRLPRSKHDAFSMTMRTLGPVYFQTTATLPDSPENTT